MFQLAAYYNQFLPAAQTRLDSILSIVSDAKAGAPSTLAAEQSRVFGLVIDISGSMGGAKLQQAKLAARRGIELLQEDQWFFVVVFHGSARVLVPACRATADNRLAAHAAIQELNAGGSTAMSRGLELAYEQVLACKASIASIYFQTDGDNGLEDTPRLHQMIEGWKGAMQVDCRGIGDQWRPAELKFIAGQLMGTADAVVNPEDLEADLKQSIKKAQGMSLSGATLRLWSPKVIKTLAVKQVSPEIFDLLPLARRVDEKTLEIELGAWGDESRDYQLSFELPPNGVGEEILACKASIVFRQAGVERVVACPPIAAAWSDNDALTTRISKEVAHYSGQSELAEAIQQGLEAQAQGQDDVATRLLGKAARIAEASGNEEVTRRLRKVVDVVDAPSGTVRLKKVEKGDAMALEMGATRTVRRRAAAPAAEAPTAANAQN